MPWIIQMLGFALFLLGIAIALWVSLWLLVVLFVIGFGIALFTYLRGYLVAKGILNPTPGVPMGGAMEEESFHQEQITIVDADFTRVDEEKQAR
jgi:hypothetical protein